MEIFLLVVLVVAGIAWSLITKSPPPPVVIPKKKRSLLDRSDPENEAFFSEGVASNVGLPHINLRISPSYRADFKSPWEEDSQRPQQDRECSLRINYTDAEERNSERNIAIYKSSATNHKFDAWCSLRCARRTFFFSRIQSAIDLETGEVLSVAQVFRRVHPTRKIPKEIAFL